MGSHMSDHTEMVTTHLAHQVQQQLGPNCPCCGFPMRVPRGRKALANYVGRDRRTIAHDFPVGRGGSAKVWVYACRGCNQEQGDLTFWLWAKVLDRAGDPRAGRVYKLAAIIQRYRKAYKEARTNVDFAVED